MRQCGEIDAFGAAAFVSDFVAQPVVFVGYLVLGLPPRAGGGGLAGIGRRGFGYGLLRCLRSGVGGGVGLRRGRDTASRCWWWWWEK